MPCAWRRRCAGGIRRAEGGADGGVSVGARRRGHTGGECRDREVVIDEQHESRVDGGADGCRGVPRPGQRQRDVVVGVTAEGDRETGEQRPPDAVQRGRRGVVPQGIVGGEAGEGGAQTVHGAGVRRQRRHHLARAPDGGVGGIDALGIPEPGDDIGERAVDEIAGAATAVEQLVVLDVGDVGVHDAQRHAGGGVRGRLCGGASPPGREGLDLEGVEGRAARVALAAEQPAGDVGVHRLGLDAESGGGLGGGEAGEGRWHLDPINVDAVDVMFAH